LRVDIRVERALDIEQTQRSTQGWWLRWCASAASALRKFPAVHVGAFRANHTRPFSLAHALSFSRGRGRGGSAECSAQCPLGHSGDSKLLLGAPARRLDQLRRWLLVPNIATVANAMSCLCSLYCLLSTLYYIWSDSQGSRLRSPPNIRIRVGHYTRLPVITKRSIS